MKSEVLSDYLIKRYNENNLSHAFLIETCDVEKTNFEIKKFIKCIFNSIQNIDNLIDNDSFPELIIINPDGKTIKTDSISKIKERFANKPMYLPKNIYIINYPELMNASSFNKLLKFLEEPEEDILGFLVTQNNSLVADTIISRCENITIHNNNFSVCEIKPFVTEYYYKLINFSDNILWYNCNVISKNLIEKKDYIDLFQELFEIFSRNYEKNNKIAILYLISKYLEKLNYNVNTSLILDSFALEIGDLIEK